MASEKDKKNKKKKRTGVDGEFGRGGDGVADAVLGDAFVGGVIFAVACGFDA